MAANSYHISLIVVLSSCAVHTLGFRVPQTSLPVVVNTWDFKPATDAGKNSLIYSSLELLLKNINGRMLVIVLYFDTNSKVQLYCALVK